MKQLPRIIFIAFLTSIFSVVVSCSTPYQASGFGGGYKDFQLNEDTYQISFRGNGYTGAGQVQSYALRRAAELTQQKGYNYFLILGSGHSVDESHYVTPATVQTSGSGYTHGYVNYNRYNAYTNHSSTTTITPAQEYSFEKHTQNIVIKMLKDNKNYPNALNAKIILQNFGH